MAVFTWHEALSCIFPLVLFLALALTKIVHVPLLPRYDIILIVALLTQWVLYRTGIETLDEVKVIFVFHLIGFALEVYKVHTGSWVYPGFAWTKVFGVPLYSGFMYSSVASYMCQVWRRMHLHLSHWPSARRTIPLGILIYVNFFTDHFFYDIRWVLIVLLILAFWSTTVQFRLGDSVHRMPLLVSFLLIGVFVWFAENFATYFEAWQYPYQREAWHAVSYGKISSWSLLVIVSFMIVAQLKHVKEGRSSISSSKGVFW